MSGNGSKMKKGWPSRAKVKEWPIPKRVEWVNEAEGLEEYSARRAHVLQALPKGKK